MIRPRRPAKSRLPHQKQALFGARSARGRFGTQSRHSTITSTNRWAQALSAAKRQHTRESRRRRTFDGLNPIHCRAQRGFAAVSIRVRFQYLTGAADRKCILCGSAAGHHIPGCLLVGHKIAIVNSEIRELADPYVRCIWQAPDTVLQHLTSRGLRESGVAENWQEMQSQARFVAIDPLGASGDGRAEFARRPSCRDPG